jgi:gliding motility-associated-like protein
MNISVNNLLFATLLSLTWLNNASAQTISPSGNKKYRVTAYKLAGTTLTSLSNIAEATPNPTMYIPSAFTPNGDGINDFFGVKAEGIKQFKMEIYNRWGELVFFSENMLEHWDGTFKGERISNTDVFVYQVKAIGKNNNPLPEEKGTVTLIAEGIVE